MSSSAILETERLRLRCFSEADATFALELVNEPDFLRFIGDKRVRDLEGARAYLRDGPMAMVAEHGHGLYLVEDRASGEALGMCGLITRPGLEHVDVGFAFLERFRRRGYGFESAEAVIRHGREQLGLETIVAIASPDNEASAALLAKLGLFPAGPIHA